MATHSNGSTFPLSASDKYGQSPRRQRSRLEWGRYCLVVLSSVLAWGASGTNASAGRISFLVAEIPGTVVHGDSFVVTIDEADTSRLTQARKLISWIEAGAPQESAPDGRIVFSAIATGSNGINRNLTSPPGALWSWHPVGDVDFVDMTIEIYDGWPTFIEDDVPGWMANTQGAGAEGNIGFWTYTIVRELGLVPEPVASGSGALLAALALASYRRRKREETAKPDTALQFLRRREANS